MNISRRNMIKAIGATICAGLTPTFVASLLPEVPVSGVKSGITSNLKMMQEAINRVASSAFQPTQILVSYKTYANLVSALGDGYLEITEPSLYVKDDEALLLNTWCKPSEGYKLWQS